MVHVKDKVIIKLVNSEKHYDIQSTENITKNNINTQLAHTILQYLPLLFSEIIKNGSLLSHFSSKIALVRFPIIFLRVCMKIPKKKKLQDMGVLGWCGTAGAQHS